MRYEEKQLTAASEELKEFSASIMDHDALADLDMIIAGFQTMRPYVRVGLRVCPSDEALEAINRLHESGLLTPALWNTLVSTVELARKGNVPSPVQQVVTA